MDVEHMAIAGKLRVKWAKRIRILLIFWDRGNFCAFCQLIINGIYSLPNRWDCLGYNGRSVRIRRNRPTEQPF